MTCIGYVKKKGRKKCMLHDGNEAAACGRAGSLVRLVVVVVELLQRTHLEQAQGWLVGVLHQNVLALGQLHTLLDDVLEDAPHVVQTDVELLGELVRFVELRAHNDVVVCILHVEAGYVSKLDGVRPRQEGLRRPLGELVGVVLQLHGEHRAALGVQLLAPVNAGVLGVNLVEGLDEQELVLLALGLLQDGVDLAAGHQHNAVAQIPAPVAIGARRNILTR
mmetsp:Transcript_53338/g.133909  ORF Transcript_53338/g.133909 Transcript_53338/m.133909 type:complete len:221 (+) Transcript_53338:20-682(+)